MEEEITAGISELSMCIVRHLRELSVYRFISPSQVKIASHSVGKESICSISTNVRKKTKASHIEELDAIDSTVKDSEGLETVCKGAAEVQRGHPQERENIFQGIGQPTVVLAPGRTIPKAKRAAATAAGLTEKTFIGKRCYQLSHRTDTYPAACSPVCNTKGRLCRTILNAIDIADRKQAELVETFCVRERRFHRILDTQEDAISMHGPEKNGMPGAFTEVNNGASERVGHSRWRDRSLRPLDMNAPEEVNDIPELLHELLQKGAVLLVMKSGRNDSLKFLKELRKNYPQVPVIPVTGYREELVRAVQVGLRIDASFHGEEPLTLPAHVQRLKLARSLGTPWEKEKGGQV
jgi:CheY-like chemotaxis protein